MVTGSGFPGIMERFLMQQMENIRFNLDTFAIKW